MDTFSEVIIKKLINFLNGKIDSNKIDFDLFQEVKNEHIEKLNIIFTLINKKIVEYNVIEKSIESYIEVLLKFAEHNYTEKAEISNHDLLDSLAVSINFLGEELNYSTITTHYLQDIFNSMDDFLIAIDSSGYIISVNNSLLKRLNFSKDEMLNYSVIKFFSNQIDINNFVNDDYILKNHFLITSDGEKVPVQIKTSKFLRGDDISIGKVIIARDITNTLKYQNQIENQNIQLLESIKKAQESDKLKSAFLSNLSHEIRTPMNAIVGFSDLLELEDDAEVRKQYVKIIQKRSYDLLNIIDDILDASKIESGQMSINKSVVSLYQFIHVINDYFNEERIIIENRDKVELKYSINNNLHDISIKTDFDRLKQVFINLIKNAFKFTSAGTIEFGVDFKDDSNLLFYVFDTGAGIPKDKWDIIFKPFRQVNDSHNYKNEGNGLGLSICKGIIDLLGGKIWFESKENEGSKFYFTIPYET